MVQWFDSPDADPVVSPQQMGALGKIGFILQNIADPSTLPKYQQSLQQQQQINLARQERESKAQREQRVAALAADPAFLALPPNEQIARIVAETGDQSALSSFVQSQVTSPFEQESLNLKRRELGLKEAGLARSRAALGPRPGGPSALGGIQDIDLGAIPPVDLNQSYPPVRADISNPLTESSLAGYGAPETMGPVVPPAMVAGPQRLQASALASNYAPEAVPAPLTPGNGPSALQLAYDQAFNEPDKYMDNFLSMLAEEQKPKKILPDGTSIPAGFVPVADPTAPGGVKIVKIAGFEDSLKPETAIAKLNADLRAGNITQQQFDDALAKENSLPEGKAKARSFAERMQLAERNLNLAASDGGQNAGTGLLSRTAGIIEAVPSFGAGDALGGAVRRNFSTAPEQQYYNSARAWIINKLRKDSGATIRPEEIQTEYATYFPMPGDGEENILQKEIMRNQVTKTMSDEGGVKYTPPPKITPKELTRLQELEAKRGGP